MGQRGLTLLIGVRCNTQQRPSEGTELNFVSKVRNGFVPQLRREVWGQLKHLEADGCPFANLPEKKRTQWAPLTPLKSAAVYYFGSLQKAIVAVKKDRATSPKGRVTAALSQMN